MSARSAERRHHRAARLLGRNSNQQIKRFAAHFRMIGRVEQDVGGRIVATRDR
jgi:hypothetical protein